MKHLTEELLALSENCGYAIATMEAFMSPQGSNAAQIREAIERLQESSVGLSELIGKGTKS